MNTDGKRASVKRALGLLATLQQADSFFPGGAMAFSWGLKSLQRDGKVYNADTLVEYLDAHLLYRWATCDQGVLVAACKASQADDPLSALMEVDAYAHAISLVPSLREGSCRLGRNLASVHSKLGQAEATRFLQRIQAKQTPGHLAVVQAYVWRAGGMSDDECRLAAAHGNCIGAVSAAVRLSLIGHLDAQRALNLLRERLADVLAADAPALEAVSSCAFAIDIAALRHAQLQPRLFAN